MRNEIEIKERIALLKERLEDEPSVSIRNIIRANIHSLKWVLNER